MNKRDFNCSLPPNLSNLWPFCQLNTRCRPGLMLLNFGDQMRTYVLMWYGCKPWVTQDRESWFRVLKPTMTPRIKKKIIEEVSQHNKRVFEIYNKVNVSAINIKILMTACYWQEGIFFLCKIFDFFFFYSYLSRSYKTFFFFCHNVQVAYHSMS